MKECTNDYFEEDIPEDYLTDALERENAAILEIELEMENEPEVSRIPEASTRKKLKRELEQDIKCQVFLYKKSYIIMYNYSDAWI